VIKFVEFPAVLALLSAVVMSGSVWIGLLLRQRFPPDPDSTDYRSLYVGSTIGLLSLLIGFTLSMSVARYDLRKTYEAEEANAIGTEYSRIDLLNANDQKDLRELMAKYLDARIQYYRLGQSDDLERLAAKTTDLQDALWARVARPGATHPNAITSLVVSGMNEVLDDQGYTESAWRNRLPRETWVLMLVIALVSCVLLGITAPKSISRASVLSIMPGVIAISFFLIADIDSPRSGILRIDPQNLIDLVPIFNPPHGH